MVTLLDVNVVVALVLSEHAHHQRATDWLLSDGIETGWATCLVTELAAIRICMEVTRGWSAHRAAKEVRWLRHCSRSHRWWTDEEQPARMLDVRQAAKAKQVNDRYLLGFARSRGARLVTFDRGIASYGGPHVICLTPPRD
jgi:toxin-antitoxin system PIN domain toxin